MLVLKQREKTFYGLKGYLANITEDDENNFILDKIRKEDGTVAQGWIGASDEADEGKWKWLDGPEDGVQFWQGKSKRKCS